MTPEQTSNEKGSIANYIKISVSHDRLSAHVDFRDPPLQDEGISFSGQELLQALTSAGFTQGLISEAEAELLLQGWLSKM